MTTFNEKLDRGLFTAASRTLLPEGALTKARNARYSPGDPAIRQAEGSTPVGAALAQIHSLLNVQWDPGATRRSDILFGSGAVLGLVAAKKNPTDPEFTAAVQLSPPAGAGTKVKNIVAAGQGFYIQTDGKGMFLSEVGGEPVCRSHGLPLQTLKCRPYASVTSTQSPIAQGRYYLWFTWYDSVNEIESAASIDATHSFTVYSTTANTSNIGIYVAKALFDVAWAAAGYPDSIRVYRSLAWDTSTLASGFSRTNPFPVGFLIDEVQSAGILGSTVIFDEVPQFPDELPGGEYYAVTSGYQISPALDEYVKEEAEYPVVDIGILYSKNGEPPRATTGDIHEDSLLLNDIVDRSIVRYSPPGEWDSFPDPYYIPFRTAERDEVMCIRSLGAITGVICSKSIWRLNYLALEGDLNFRTGKARDLVAVGIGALNEKGACKVDIEGKGAMLAVVDRTGLYLTDLDTVTKISAHLDWSEVLPDPSKFVAITNNLDAQRLELWTQDGAWFFHYDPVHIQDGLLAVTGPIERTMVEAVEGMTLEDGSSTTVLAMGGSAQLTYNGIGTPGALEVETRDIFPAGPGAEVRSITLHAEADLVGAGASSLTLAVTGRVKNTETLRTSKEFPVAESTLVITPIRQLVEALKFRLSSSAEFGIKVSFVGASVEGLEDAQHA